MDKFRKRVRFCPIKEETTPPLTSPTSRIDTDLVSPISFHENTEFSTLKNDEEQRSLNETRVSAITEKNAEEKDSYLVVEDNKNGNGAPSIIEEQTYIDILNHQEKLGITSDICYPAFHKKIFIIEDKVRPNITQGIQSSKVNKSSNNKIETKVKNTDLGIESNFKPHLKRNCNKSKLPKNILKIFRSTMGSLPNEAISAEVTELSRSSPLKDQLQNLNNRLSYYVQHMRQNSSSVAVQSSSALKQVQKFEEDLVILKRCYEEELESLRNQLESVNEERNRLQLETNNNQVTLQELRDLISVSESMNANLKSKMATLEHQLKETESRLLQQQADSRTKGALIDQSQYSKNIVNLRQQLADLKQKYEGELLQRQQSELRFNQLQKKYDFTKQVSDQTMDDMRKQIAMSNEIIASLEEKVEQLGSAESQLPSIMERVREVAVNEVQKVQASTDEQIHRYVEAQRSEADINQQKLLALQMEKSKQQMEISQLRADNNDLQAQIITLEQQKLELQQQITQEQLASNEQLQVSERKLAEVFEIMSCRSQQKTEPAEEVAIEAEVEAYNLLLSEEEKRLGRSLSPSGTCRNPTVMVHPHSLHLLNSHAELAKQVNQRTHDPLGTIPAEPGQLEYFIYQTDPIKNSLNYEIANRTENSKELTHQPYETGLISGPSPRPVGPIVQQQKQEIRDSRRSSSLSTDSPDYRGETLPQQDGHRPHSSSHESYHDYRVATASATGQIRIFEVQKDGRYIRLLNDRSQDVDISNYLIQQNVGGHPVAVYRFPPRTMMAACSTVTVWAGCCDPTVHLPPTDFYWKEQEKWGTGPECTTILCKPNSQAVAWTTAAHRFTRNLYDDMSRPSTATSEQDELLKKPISQLGEVKILRKPEPIYLRRKKITSPVLRCRSPYAEQSSDTHPHAAPHRPLNGGNDGLSVNRQTRSQTMRPDHDNGQPYAGSGNPTMRKMPARPVNKSNPHKSSSGRLLSHSAPVILSRAQCPNPFMKPRTRYETGLYQIRDQYADNQMK